DWKLIFVVYAATTLLAAGWLLAAVPPQPLAEAEERATFGSTLSLFADSYITGLFLCILCIVGIDVGLNTCLPRLLMEKTGMPLGEAGLGTSLYFAARTGGSFLGALLLAKWSAKHFLRWSIGVAVVAFVVLLAVPALGCMFAMIVVVGLACANVFSIVFSFALQHKPERANEISALMIMGVSGGALITPLMGVAADAFGQVAGLSVLLLCMAYIGFASIKLIQ
ncbi:MAG: MFS transporter, partial [Tannerellaceae bacterium]